MAFGGCLRQSTAVDVLIGPFLDDTDGKTAETGLTISQADVKLSKNGQALAQKNDDTAASHDANGYYNCPLNTTDTNTLGQLTVVCHPSGALATRIDFQVVTANWFDSMCSTDKLEVDLSQIGGSAVSTSSAQLGVNVVQIEGSDATNQIRDSIVDDSTRIDASALNTLSGHDPGENIMGATDIATEMGRIDAAVSSRSSHAAADVWAVGTRTLTSFGPLVADIATAVWGAVTRTLTGFAFTPSLDSAYDAAKTAAQTGEAAAAALALQGADGDTLETLSDQIDTIGATSLPHEWPYTVTDADSGDPISDVTVTLTSDSAGTVLLRSAITDSTGIATFYFKSADVGTTVYVWRQKAGVNFTDPDTEVID